MVHLCSLLYCAAEYVDGNLKSKQTPEEKIMNAFSLNVLAKTLKHFKQKVNSSEHIE